MGIMINNNFSSIEQVTGTYLKSQDAGKVAVAAENTSFEQIFKDKAFGTERELKFSKHAGSRLEQRNINLSEDQLSRLNNAAKKAGEKGIKESLMIMYGRAFIFNVRNNTVITAMEQNENSENVFTNIDGAVIA